MALCATLVAATLVAATPAAAASSEQVEEWPLREVPEPSGIAYHAARKSLFVVGDEGHIAEVALDGRLIRVRKIGGDLEGVTCDPRTGAVYTVREGVDTILEIRPSDLSIVRAIAIGRSYNGDSNYLRNGGDGVEGITVKPGTDGADGPTFYAVNQFDPPVLVELSAPSGAPAHASATIVHAWPVATAPLSDVSWDPVANAFVIVSAIWRTAYLVSATGAEVGSVHLPGFMQEGIARLPDGSFVITQDTGGLLRWKPPSDPFERHQDQAGAAAHDAVGTQNEN